MLSTVQVSWYLWASCFVGSTLNANTHRYAGHRGYRTSRPFFLGLILGQVFVAGMWLVIDYFTGKSAPFDYPGLSYQLADVGSRGHNL